MYYLNKFFSHLFLFLILTLAVSCISTSSDNITPAEKITISFNTQDGNNVPNQTIDKGTKLTNKPSDPTKNNFKFTGWYTLATGGTKINLDSNIFNETTTIYAQWTQLQTFNIAFHPNKPESVTVDPENVPKAPQNVTEGQTAVIPTPAPTLTNYNFIGWFNGFTTGATLTLADTPFDFATAINENKNLYAKWSRIQLTVNYNVNKPTGVTATIINPPSSVTVNSGDVTTEPTPKPTLVGYNFLGWYQSATPDDNAQPFDFSTLINQEITLYAKWTLYQTFTITYHANKPQDVTDNPENVPTAPLIVIENRSISAPSPAPTLTNYDFIGWFEGTATGTTLTLADTDFDFTNTINESKELYAKWSRIQLIIAYNLNKPTGVTATITNPPNPVTISSGDITTEPTPKPTLEGYNFLGWYQSATPDNNAQPFDFSSPINQEKTLYAKWELKQAFTITYHANKPNGVTTDVSNLPAPVSVYNGDTTTEPTTAPTLTGRNFLGWYQSATPDDNAQPFDFATTIDNNKNLYAKWTQDLVVTYNTQGGSNIQKQSVTHGGTITRPTNDPTRNHYTFDNWYTTAETGGQTVTFPYTVNENTTFYARWTRIQYTVTFNPNYPDAQTTEDTVNSGETTNAPDPQPTRIHYTFDNWYTTAETGGQTITFPYTVNENKIFYAHWTRKQYTIIFNPNYPEATNTPITVQGGELLTPQPNPTRSSEFTFQGWFKGNSPTQLETNAFNFEVAPIESITLYAKWVQGIHVSFDTQGGSTIEPQVLLTGVTTATRPTTDPTKIRHEFVNWYDNVQGTGDPFLFTTTITTTKTLYAVWNKVEWLFSFNTLGGSDIENQTIPVNGNAIRPIKNPVKNNFTFNNWYDNEQGTGLPFNFANPIIEDTIVYAKWDKMPFSITFDLGYETTPRTTLEVVNQLGKVFKANPSPRDKYIFKGWYDAETEGNKIDFNAKTFNQAQTLFAQWELITITFNEGYGDPPNTVTQKINAAGNIVGKSNPTRNFFTFNGWFIARTGGVAIVFTTKVFTTPTTLFAQWSLTTKRTITFNDNDGTSTPNTDTVQTDNQGKVTKSDPIQRDKYTFIGWYTLATGGDKINLTTKEFGANQTLFAQWELVTITFNDGYGTPPSTSTQMINTDGKIIDKNNPTRDLYTFKGWFTMHSDGFLVDLEIKVFTTPTTVFAQWKRITKYTISFNLGYGDSIIIENYITNNDGKVSRFDPDRDKYEFKGWYTLDTGGEEVNLLTTVFESDLTFYAKWELVTITFNDGYGNSPATTTQQINNEGKIVGKTDPTRNLYTFIGWFTMATTGGDQVNLTNKVFISPTTLYAQWTREKYVITFNYNDENPPLTQPTKTEVNANAMVSAPTNLPDRTPHYTFTSWHTNNSLADDTAFDFENTAITADLALYAKWTRKTYTVTLNHNDGKTPTATTSTLTSDQLGYIQKPANPTHTVNTNKFVNWYTVESPTDSDTPFIFATQIIIADMNLYAVWTQQKNIVSFNTLGGSDVPSQAIPIGQSASNPNLNPTKKDFAFVAWFTMEQGGEIYSFSTTINDDKTIYARWRHRPETKGALLAEINNAIITVSGDVNLNYIDTSLIKDMSSLFIYKTTFNGNISNWNVSAVENMNRMFHSAIKFNQDLNNWNVAAVENMSEMFYSASKFNGNISDWNVATVNNMSEMFYGASDFNGNINDWNVATVENMYKMFWHATKFNQDLNNWNVATVTTMESMFNNANVFNGNISSWNVSAVINMKDMFNNAAKFNQDLNNWNVSAVKNTHSMFWYASVFNGNISGWNVSALTNMESMFYGASAFIRNIDSWNVVASVNKKDAFASSGLALSIPIWAR